MIFADQLRAARERLGITQPEAANILDVSAEWVSKTERNLTTPLAITQEGALARLRATKTPRKAKGQNDKISLTPNNQ